MTTTTTMMDNSHSNSNWSMDPPFMMYETPEAKKLRREFRRQQVELLELSAVGLGLQLQEVCQKLDLEWNCLKMMDSQNLNISNHSLRGSSSSLSRNCLPRRALSTPDQVRPSLYNYGGISFRRTPETSVSVQVLSPTRKPQTNPQA